GVGPRATPAVEAERLYCIGASGIFHCLDAERGSVIWKRDLQEEFGAKGIVRGPEFWGHSGSPLVDGEVVLISTGGPDGAVAAFQKQSGALIWKALQDPAGYSSPIALTIDGVRQAVFLTGRALVGLSMDDGALLWRFPWETKDDCNIATPIAVGNYVF